jgi:hypothetical protein
MVKIDVVISELMSHSTHQFADYFYSVYSIVAVAVVAHVMKNQSP